MGLITYASQSEAFHAPMMDWIAEGLARHGYAEPLTVEIQRHYGERDRQAMAQAAMRLAEWAPDVIISTMTNADIAVLAATERLATPVVCWSMDPLDSGLVPSMREPGGRLTGVAFPPGLAWLQLRAWKTLVPHAWRLGYLHNPGYAPATGALDKLRHAAQATGLVLDVREVTNPSGIAPAIRSIKMAGADGLLVGPHEIFNGNGGLIGETALALGLAAIGQESVARGGGVVAFMPDFPRIWDTAAAMAARILAGSTPADMPIDRHIAPLMILNSGAAATLGLHVPASFADEAASLID